MMISLRGNARIVELEREINACLPEKLSRTKLLERAIHAAYSNQPDWEKAYLLLRSTKPTNIKVPDFLQARLDERSDHELGILKKQIKEAIGLERTTNLFAWQILLANLLLSERKIDRNALEHSGQQQPNLPLASSIEAVELMGILVKLLQKEEPTDQDHAVFAKISNMLHTWNKQL